MTRFEEIVEELRHIGWEMYMENVFSWKYGDTGRFVDIDLPYIDIYTYNNGEKYCGYLTSHEFDLFNDLLKCEEFLNKHEENLIV